MAGPAGLDQGTASWILSRLGVEAGRGGDSGKFRGSEKKGKEKLMRVRQEAHNLRRVRIKRMDKKEKGQC